MIDEKKINKERNFYTVIGLRVLVLTVVQALSFAWIIPELINLHNDFATITGFLLAVGVTIYTVWELISLAVRIINHWDNHEL